MQRPDSSELILAVNAGSSSVKLAAFAHADNGLQRVWSGRRALEGQSHQRVVDELLRDLADEPAALAFDAIAHRIVHGGPDVFEPQLIDSDLLVKLRAVVPLAPVHLPPALDLVEHLCARHADAVHLACFDTAFHRHLPRVAQLLPIPRALADKGIRRYGFHGLSYAFLLEELARTSTPDVANGRVIFAHLGSGVSLAAVERGRSIDTTMGFTPAGGVMMSTRSGDLDPGVGEYLARTEGMSAAEFHAMAAQRSGLLGVSGISGDLRALLAQEQRSEAAAEAVALFCYQIRKAIGALVAALGGLDTLVFSGGVGENLATIRERICEGLPWFGIILDPTLNRRHAPIISGATTRVRVCVIPTDEERYLAGQAVQFLPRASFTFQSHEHNGS